MHEDVLLEVVLQAWQPMNDHVNVMLQELFRMFDTSGDGCPVSSTCSEIQSTRKSLVPEAWRPSHLRPLELRGGT